MSGKLSARRRKAHRNRAAREAKASRSVAQPPVEAGPAMVNAGPVDPFESLRARIEGRRMARVAT